MQSIFFSWQSDSPSNIGKVFLEEILKKICHDISNDLTLEEAQRQEIIVDSDTQNVPGQPPVFQTILEKIDKAVMFIADLTFVGDRNNGKGPIPNPNVLIEHGYALKSLKHERILHVMNTAYGKPSRENMPFDLAHLKFPLTYFLPENATKDQIDEEGRKLYEKLNAEIRISLKAAPKVNLDELANKFLEQTPKNGPARFRAQNEELGIQDDAFFWGDEKGNKKVFFPPQGPAMWLRVMPKTNNGVRFRSAELRKIVKGERGEFPTLINRSGGYDFVRASDGMGKYYAQGNKAGENGGIILVPSATFIFSTGEIWGSEFALLEFANKRIPFAESSYIASLDIYARLLDAIGVKGPYSWIAGMTGVKDRRLAMPPPPPGKRYIDDLGDTCVVDTIEDRGEFELSQNPAEVLRPFFEEIFDKCGMERPAHLG